MTPKTTARVTLFRRKRTGCNFSTFLQPRGRKPGERRVSCQSINTLQPGFRQRTKAVCRSSTTIQWDVSHFFGANAEVAIFSNFLKWRTEKGSFFLGRLPSPPSESRLRSCPTIQWDVSHFFGANAEVAIFSNFFEMVDEKKGLFFGRPSSSSSHPTAERGPARPPKKTFFPRPAVGTSQWGRQGAQRGM